MVIRFPYRVKDLAAIQKNFDYLHKFSFLVKKAGSGKELEYQVFNVTFINVPAGVATMPFNLPVPWPKSHDFVVASLNNSTAGNWGASAAGTSGLGTGNCFMINPALQTLGYTIISFGT